MADGAGGGVATVLGELASPRRWAANARGGRCVASSAIAANSRARLIREDAVARLRAVLMEANGRWRRGGQCDRINSQRNSSAGVGINGNALSGAVSRIGVLRT